MPLHISTANVPKPVDLMYWTGTNTDSPGRLGQLAVEVVNSTTFLNRSAYNIHLRTDSGKYMAVSPYWYYWYQEPVLHADAVSPAENGTLFTAVQSTLNASFLEIYIYNTSIILGEMMGISDSRHTHIPAMFLSAMNFPFMTRSVHPEKVVDLSFQSNTRPLLSSGSLAPFSHNDVVQVGIGALPRYSYLEWNLNNTVHVDGASENVTGAIYFAAKNATAQQYFRVKFVDDPKDGLVTFATLNGSGIAFANITSTASCFSEPCSPEKYDVLYLNSQAPNMIWKLTVVGINNAEQWRLQAMTNLGANLTMAKYLTLGDVYGQANLAMLGSDPSGDGMTFRFDVVNPNSI